MDIHFDDSNWSPAVALYANGNKTTTLAIKWLGSKPVLHVRPQAYWIWTAPIMGVAKGYCRGRLTTIGRPT